MELGEFENLVDASHKALGQIAGGKAVFADCRLVAGTAKFAVQSLGEDNAAQNDFTGAGFRVLMKGNWGFASTNLVDLKGLVAAAKKAARLASGGSGKALIDDGIIPSYSKRFDLGGFASTQGMELDWLCKTASEAKKEIESAREIKSAKVTLAAVAARRAVINSWGLEAIECAGRQRGFFEATAKRGANTQTAHESKASTGVCKWIGECCSLAAAAASKAQKLLDAQRPPKGTFTVVIDGKLAGVLAHEAVGHAAEGDTVASGGSVLGGLIGKRIASKEVTITDSNEKGGFGSYSFDDEGIEKKRVLIVEKGIFKSYLTSLETATRLGVGATGNCRAGGYSQLPIVRMSNTCVARGKDEHDKVFGISRGLYLKGMKGGSVDPVSGHYVFAAEEGYVIENGEIGKQLRDCSLTGNVLETLKNVEAVGRDFDTSPGMCGKSGQSVPVSDGGPHMRIGKVTLG